MMHAQLSSAVAEACQAISSNAGPVAIGFDAAAREDNWGICVLALSHDLSSAQMPLLLPQARINSNGQVSPTLLCRPNKELLVEILRHLNDLNLPVSLGVDIPFGWPDEHRFFVDNWTAQQGWHSEHAIPHRDNFERRWCDIAIKEKYPYIKPLSVGADTIAQAAFCWSLVRNEWRDFPITVDVGLEPVQNMMSMFETYPGAFVKLAASDFGTYKRKPAVRQKLLATLKAQYQLALEMAQVEWLEWACAQRGSPDAFDSFLCALCAWDHMRERSTPGSVALTTPKAVLNREVLPAEADRIRREGWILVRSK